MLLRKYDNRRSIIIYFNSTERVWIMKHRSNVKSEIVKLIPMETRATNPVQAKISDCELYKRNKWRNWTETCLTLPTLHSTILNKQINVTIHKFDFSYCSKGRSIEPWR